MSRPSLVLVLLLCGLGCSVAESSSPAGAAPGDDQAPRPTAQRIPDEKSGISLQIKGDYGTHFLVERLYHDARIDPGCVIYVDPKAPLHFVHNEFNVMNRGRLVGADGGGVIRYRVDQDLTKRARFSDHPSLYPAWEQPRSFSALTYDPGKAVVGSFGPLPGVAAGDEKTFYCRGVKGPFGDEWHVIAVGDDDQNATSPEKPTYYAHNNSDGKLFTFVVGPRTPSLAVVPKDMKAQFYTRAPKAYFVPKVHAQTTFVSGDVDLELAALGRRAVMYSLRSMGESTDVWKPYTAPLNVKALRLAADSVHELRYRIGADGPVKTRLLHVEPGYPSDAETHPQNILWKGQAGLDRIRARLRDPSNERSDYRRVYGKLQKEGRLNRRVGGARVALLNGRRENEIGLALLANAFPLLIDGLKAHPDMARLVHDACLDNLLNLDPVGCEIPHFKANPTRELNYQGYHSMTTPFSVALAYDWLIKDFRRDRHPAGFTAIEDVKIRDMLAKFAQLTALRMNEPYPNTINANGSDEGMWSTAWLAATQVIAAVMPTYDTALYGTSGAPVGAPIGGPPKARRFAPFPDHGVTWWQLANDRTVPIPGYPNLSRRSGFYGLLDPKGQWHNRRGYWDHQMMGWIYYMTANFRANYDGHHYPHFETAFEAIAEGRLMPSKNKKEGPLHHRSVLLINRNFPKLAGKLQALLGKESKVPEKSIRQSLAYHGVLSLCLYEDDWFKMR